MYLKESSSAMLNGPICERALSFNREELIRHERTLSMYLKEEERKHGGVSQLVNLLLSNFLQNIHVGKFARMEQPSASDQTCRCRRWQA